MLGAPASLQEDPFTHARRFPGPPRIPPRRTLDVVASPTGAQFRREEQEKDVSAVVVNVPPTVHDDVGLKCDDEQLSDKTLKDLVKVLDGKTLDDSLRIMSTANAADTTIKDAENSAEVEGMFSYEKNISDVDL